MIFKENYEDILIESVHRINKGVNYDAIKEALYKLHNFENGELVQKNAVFMDYLQNGIPVRYVEKGEEKHKKQRQRIVKHNNTSEKVTVAPAPQPEVKEEPVITETRL